MSSRFFLVLILSLLSFSNARAFTPAPAPEHTEQIPTSPDYRSVNGYYYGLQFSPEWGGGLFLGLDISNRIINLTPTALSPGHVPELSLDDFRNGLRFTRTRGFDAALGPNGFLESAEDWGKWTPFVGLMPVYGRRSTSSQYVSDHQQMSDLPKLKVPGAPTDLEQWNLNDWLVYETTGGVMFHGGSGSTVLAAAELRFMAAGEWSVAIEKTGIRTVYVRIGKKNIQSFTQIIGALTVVIDNNLFQNKDESFSYSFDLDDPEALVAYHYMLGGNLLPAEELSVRATGAVRAVASTKSKGAGRLTTLRFGFPFFSYTGKTKGRIQISQLRAEHADGSESSVETGIHLNERATGGVLLIQRRTVNDFIATSAVTKNKEQVVTQNTYSGEFVWAYENEKASYKRVRKQLDKIVAQTGLRDELAVIIPNVPLGYFQTSLRVLIDEKTTNELIEASRDRLSDDGGVRSLSSSFVQQYFADGDDKDRLCGRIHRIRGSLARCARKLEKDTGAALKEAAVWLQEMENAKRASNRRAFVAAYAAAGKFLFANQFTVKATLALLRNRPPAIQFAVAGERVSLLKKTIEQKITIP